MKMSFRIFALILSVALLLASVVGCRSTNANTSPTAGTTAGSTPAETAEGTMPPSSEPIKISYMTADFANVEYSVGAGYKGETVKAVEKFMKDLFNIEFEYEFFPAGQNAESVVMPLVASGSQLPDVINYDFTRAKLIELYNQGIIIGLSDLVKNNAPVIYERYYKLSPEGLPENCSNDGQLLRIVEYCTNIQNLIRVLGVRYDWLKQLNMNIPTTVDEFTAMLKAFRDNDMNQNGQPDEIMSMVGYADLNRSLADAFGVKRLGKASDSWYMDANGKVYNTMLSNNTKEYIKYVNQLLSDGLLDNEFTTQTAEQYNVKFNANRIGATAGYNWMAYNSMVLEKNGIKSEYVQISPLKQTNGGDPAIYVDPYFGHKTHVLTKDCKNPEAVMKWLNWCMTPSEGTRYVYYGEDGNAPDGYWMRPTKEGVADYTLTLTDKGREAAKDPNFMSKIQFNSFFPKHGMGGPVDIAIDLNDTFGAFGKGGDYDYIIEMLKNCEKAQLPYFIMFPADETQQKLLDSKADLFLYMDEMFEKFMTGKEPLSNWDSFVSQCDKMGMQEIIQMNQVRYDSYKSKLDSWLAK